MTSKDSIKVTTMPPSYAPQHAKPVFLSIIHVCIIYKKNKKKFKKRFKKEIVSEEVNIFLLKHVRLKGYVQGNDY